MRKPHIALISTCDLNIYPSMLYLAQSLQMRGCQCTLFVSIEPKTEAIRAEAGPKMDWFPIQQNMGPLGRLPFFHGDYLGILQGLRKIQPDVVIAQHGTVVSALAHKRLFSKGKKPVVAAYFADYLTDPWWMRWFRLGMQNLDAYIDVCSLRMTWRQEDWLNLPDANFVIRNAPPRTDRVCNISHNGIGRIIFTGRVYGDSTRPDLLVRFIRRLCELGHEFNWFLPGEEAERTELQQQVQKDSFRLMPAVDKARLAQALADHDVGLIWTPTTQVQNEGGDRSSYVSAAPNKLGEYLAAGLGVVHCGNPGLRFLPDSVGFAIDPFQPESEADRVSSLLADRDQLEQRRANALQYHLNHLNAAVQCEPFAEWLVSRLSLKEAN